MSDTQKAILARFCDRQFDIYTRQGRYLARYISAKKAAKVLKHNPRAILEVK